MLSGRKKILIIIIIGLIVLVGAFIGDKLLNKSYLREIKYDEFTEKISNKESFVLLLSQTTCSHCMDFKPKLANVAKEYKLEIYYIETNLLSKSQHEELNKLFSFDGTPTTIFITQGEEKTAASRINGDVSEQKIISKLKSNGFIDYIE